MLKNKKYHIMLVMRIRRNVFYGQKCHEIGKILQLNEWFSELKF